MSRIRDHSQVLYNKRLHEQDKWFGRTFTSEGVTADIDKINAIMSQGKAESSEEIRSFLMACQYNAKFLFDSHEVEESYKEITAPLRALLKKDVNFL